MRALVALLLLANLLFFGWSSGWFAAVMPPPQHGQREPERLAAQVQPEAITLLSPKAASAAVAAARAVCLEAGPFGDVDLAAAENALLTAGVPAGSWVRQTSAAAPAPTFAVYLGRFAEAAALKGKEEELRRLKLAFDELRAPAELAPGLVLSRHEQREAADAALAQASERGVRGARVVTLPVAPAAVWLRAARAEADLQARLLAVKPPLIAVPFGPCATTR